MIDPNLLMLSVLGRRKSGSNDSALGLGSRSMSIADSHLALAKSRKWIFDRTPWKWDRLSEANPEYLEATAEGYIDSKKPTNEDGLAIVRVFVSNDDPKHLVEILVSLDRVLRAIGVNVDAIEPPYQGSWYQIGVSIYRKSSAPFRKLKELIEHVQMLEPKTTHSHTQDIIALLQAVKQTESAVLLVGRILIVKRGPGAKGAVLVKELSQAELQVISANSSLLKDPDRLADVLRLGEQEDQRRVG